MANSKEVFAKNIQNLLKIHNSTREEVAKFLGVKYTTFCDWAKGRTYPKMEYIIEIADYFNVKTYALTDENPNYEKAYAEAFEENFNAPKELPIYKYNEKNALVLKAIDNVPLEWLDTNPDDDFTGLMLPDDCMEPIYQKNDTIIAIHSGYVNEGDYLLKNIKNSKLALRRLIINNDRVTMFPLNPNNKIHDITRYISKEEFDSKYEIVGKIKRHIRDFD